MPTEEEIIKNLRRCPRFNNCSTNICPLDFEVSQRTYIVGEDVCPFMTKKRRKTQKGIRTQAPDSLLEVIPESNLKMLHKRNQRRWHGLHKKDGR